MAEVARVLKPDGTFWLAIGDEFAAEMKVMLQRELGMTCRSWVVWYYTFGVNCKNKFSRSHAHLFYMVKDPQTFTFNTLAVRVPSARQLVYGDKRANPTGRLPDDTWVLGAPPDTWTLRPQDLPDGFRADADTWFFSPGCAERSRNGRAGMAARCPSNCWAASSVRAATRTTSSWDPLRRQRNHPGGRPETPPGDTWDSSSRLSMPTRSRSG